MRASLVRVRVGVRVRGRVRGRVRVRVRVRVRARARVRCRVRGRVGVRGRVRPSGSLMLIAPARRMARREREARSPSRCTRTAPCSIIVATRDSTSGELNEPEST